MALTNTLLALALLGAVIGGAPDGQVLRFSLFPAAVGNTFRTSDSLYGVYRSAEDFLSNWPRNHDCDDSCAKSIIAPLDFAREMLVVIAPRDRGQETYDVVMIGVTTTPSSVDVRFLELRHGEPRESVLCGITLTKPQPAIAVLIPQSNTPVRFLRNRADVICEDEVEVK